MDVVRMAPMAVVVVVVWAFILWLHETAHLAAASRLGDVHARALPRDPRRQAYAWLTYLGPLLVLGLFGMGTAAPAVHLPSVRARPSWKEVFVHLAGPAVHLCAAGLFALPFSMGVALPAVVALTLGFLVVLNIEAFLFSLLPLPTSDGWRILGVWMRNTPDYTSDVRICAATYAGLLIFLLSFPAEHVQTIFMLWCLKLGSVVPAASVSGLAGFGYYFENLRFFALATAALLAFGYKRLRDRR